MSWGVYTPVRYGDDDGGHKSSSRRMPEGERDTHHRRFQRQLGRTARYKGGSNLGGDGFSGTDGHDGALLPKNQTGSTAEGCTRAIAMAEETGEMDVLAAAPGEGDLKPSGLFLGESRAEGKFPIGKNPIPAPT